jgi:hypothetical protein
MDAGKHFAETVARRLRELGGNAYALEKAAGLPADAIRSVIAGGGETRVPSINRAAEICAVLGISFPLGSATGGLGQSHDEAGNYVFLPRLELAVGAGGGRHNVDPVSVDHLAFRRDWLRRINVKPELARLFTVRGDSMMPGLIDGDLVLADGGKVEPVSRKVYAFIDTDGSARLKRFEIAPDRIALRSDNPDHLTEYREGEDMNRLIVLGEIAWSARSWR